MAFVAACVVALAPSLPSGAAQAPVDLQTADSFAVLAGTGITNTGATTIWGDVGSSPIPAETGFGSVTLHGTDHAADAVSLQAKNDLTTAYNQAAGAGPPTSVAVELGGTTLTPGVYNGATLEITGTLTLDTQGDPNAVFIFQTGSTLLTAANSNVTVLNGGIACNVFWQVPSSATLGTDSHLIGTVLASTSIQATSGATIQGRLLAGTASVTLDNNTITDEISRDRGHDDHGGGNVADHRRRRAVTDERAEHRGTVRAGRPRSARRSRSVRVTADHGSGIGRDHDDAGTRPSGSSRDRLRSALAARRCAGGRLWGVDSGSIERASTSRCDAIGSTTRWGTRKSSRIWLRFTKL